LRAGRRLGGPQEFGKFTFHRFGNQPRHRGCPEDLLGLTLELGLGQPHGDDRRHALEDILFQDFVAVLQEPGVLQGIAERPSQPALEASDMGTAFRRSDDVHKRLGTRLITVPPTDGNIDVEVPLNVCRLHMAIVVKHGNRLGKPIHAS
jgi:hypothetical protein